MASLVTQIFSRPSYELALTAFTYFPIGSAILWFGNFIKMGKHSTSSRLNFPGKLGWATMECPGFVMLLITMNVVKRLEGIETLPKANWLLAGLYTIHYINRSLISPLLLAPSMAPIHLSTWAAALFFNIVNGYCIGAYLGGYGPTTYAFYAARMPFLQLGLVLFCLGLVGNIYHDDELRDLRRRSSREQEEQQAKVTAEGKGGKVERVYKVPQAGLFQYVLYPHYLCEWIEWTGFWVIGGWEFAPARAFLFNELAAMLPQAVNGRSWYLEKFGKEKIGNRKAVIPGIL